LIRQAADQTGVTLIEVLIGLVLLLVAGLIAVPSFTDYLERQRLKSAAESLAASLNLARSEALAQQQFMYVQLAGQGTGRWCYAVSNESKCDCFSSACAPVQRMDSTNLPGIELGSSSRSVFRFNWKNGSATGANGTASFVGRQGGQQLCVVLSNLGRVRIITSKNKPVAGYPQDATCR
jgi:type IV fimbrial biogenesis protein FimT